MSDGRLSHIEDLPNKLWLEIFVYLDSTDLFMAFFGINQRINYLLISQKLVLLSLSNTRNSSKSIYGFFQNISLDRYRYIQHLKLTYRYVNKYELNIFNHLSSFSKLMSLHIHFDHCFLENDYHQNFIEILFNQNCSLLQRLYVYGYYLELNINTIPIFYFPSLVHIHFDSLPLLLCIQIFNECHLLRSFSADLYYNDSPYNETLSSIVPSLRRSLSSALYINGNEDDPPTTSLSSTFMQSALIKTNVTMLTKLNLKVDCRKFHSLWQKFFEDLMPRCPNLSICVIDIIHIRNTQKFLDPDWWSYVFALNNELQCVSIELHWPTRFYDDEWLDYTIQCFQSSIFFIQLKTKISVNIDRNFPFYFFTFSIKNN